MDTDEELVARLRAGDERAFAVMVDRYHSRLIGLARQFVPSHDAAEDVAQETWLAVFRSVDRFEGRAPFRTWLFQVCVNRARTAGAKDGRHVASSRTAPSVDSDRFGADGGWIRPPEHWADRVDDQLTAVGLAARARAAIEHLPGLQNVVVTLRDVEGLTSEEVADVLSITDANQRVLLHRGRATVRRALDAWVRS